ncbi:hypothetical protein PPL_03936 [Heterostelium album PN500]|uniref:Uncharacterized protein n=1 Tax=Heterostelium pallidum (strain ATCC 26659 / Pp 5 / PN500) TaxID=670386 RepID=D3B5J8_HETP5|nr:hypothetical protein PPL_03936 [Heterostelium album PN500]EFA83146.1 hypothetical protein PPL_03936 [Heterostelium album PN500]|eukprot:XP_020435263.1 hypothetical protein PPL_03936 [Heterostelium album PN500]
MQSITTFLLLPLLSFASHSLCFAYHSTLPLHLPETNESIKPISSLYKLLPSATTSLTTTTTISSSSTTTTAVATEYAAAPLTYLLT